MPVSSRFHALLLAVAVVLAGCGSLADDPSGPPTADASVTPAPVPTASSTSTPAAPAVPAFLTDDEEGAARLATRHRQMLGRTSYRVRMNRSVVAGEETIRQLNRSIRVAESGETYRLRQTATVAGVFATKAPNTTRLSVYRNGLDGWFRTVRSNDTRYGRLRTTLRGPEVDLTESDDIERLLRAFGGVSVEIDSSPLQVSYRVRALGLVNPARLTLPPGLDSPREARLAMIVTSEGVVRSYDVTYLARYDNEIVRVHQRMTVTGRGRTSVSEPAWVPDARTATEAGEGSGRNST